MRSNAIKKLLICTFVSALWVVSHRGEMEKNEQIIETQTSKKETKINLSNLKYHWLTYHNIKFPKSNKIDIVGNKNDIVASKEEMFSENAQNIELTSKEPAYEYIDGWTAANINIREEPNTNSKILEVYKFNTHISYAKYNEEWSIIKYNGNSAYIYSKYISNKKLPEKKYTDSELYMLSHLIMGEAGGQSDKCQLYTGSVVLNRIKSNKYPDTMKGVIFQKGQYACTWDGNYNKTPTKQCIENAKYLLEHGSVLPENVVYQAGFKQGKGIYAIVDGEHFCY